jgi:hypothetical protein
MTDPVSWGVIGGLALTEGIKFLYSQAAALIESWRKRRDERAADPDAEAGDDADLPALQQSAELDGQVDQAARPDPEVLAKRIDELEQAFYALAPYGGPVPKKADSDNPTLIADVQRLRALLEEVYGQRITFKGESREATGTRLSADVRATDLDHSTVAGIRGAANAGEGTDAHANVQVTRAKDASVTGIDFGD